MLALPPNGINSVAKTSVTPTVFAPTNTVGMTDIVAQSFNPGAWRNETLKTIEEF